MISRVLPLLVIVMAVVGCATTPKTASKDSGPAKKAPSPTRFPLKVALYMDDDFRQHIYRERSFIIPLGEWLSQELPSSLEPLFAEIHVVPDQTTLEAEKKKYQAVLRPQIRFASYHPFFRERRTLLEPEGKVRIYTDWTLSDPAGRKIWIREIVGRADGDDKSRSRLEAGVQAAMVDLFKKLHIALTSSTRVYNYAYGTR